LKRAAPASIKAFSPKRDGILVEMKDFLTPLQVAVGVRATSKTRLLRELGRRAAVALGLNEDEVTSALLKREALGSTGTGAGIAIPHARLEGTARPFGILVRLAKPIDFEAIDGQPVDLVFLLLLPAEPQGDQLNALACAARMLRDAQIVRHLRGAADDAALYRAAVGNSALPKA
jgi:PTS system nitrogen regulatory IIA component